MMDLKNLEIIHETFNHIYIMDNMPLNPIYIPRSCLSYFPLILEMDYLNTRHKNKYEIFFQ